MFDVTLSAPWDATWLAEQWPNIFTLVDADRGVARVIDVRGVLELARNGHCVDVEFDGEGLSLCVFSDRSELVAA